jgi:formylglycine-generating enzyme required for sulfatase activity
VIEPTRFRPPPRTAVALPRVALPVLRYAFLSVLLATVWAAWYVLTARSVEFAVEPAGSEVEVAGFPAIALSGHWLLRPGTRRVRARAPGYLPFDGTVEIGPAPLQTHRVVLERLPGHLRIDLAPVASAEVEVDGEKRGTAPGVIRDLRAGTRQVEVRAARYLPYVTTLEIEGKDIEQSLAVRLEPGWAELALASRPSGAAVTLDGEPAGTTPVTLEPLQGRRVLELAKPGYKPWRQTLEVTAGKAVKLGEVVLAKADGLLALSSTPDEANVTLDGDFKGRTPLTLALTPDETHTLRVMKEGYASVERKLGVPSGERETLAVELAPELATIRLTTEPADAELLVDGKPAGSATQTLELPTHDHVLTVRRAGYATYETTVTPRKGLEKRYRIRLKTLAEVATAGAAPGAPTVPGTSAIDGARPAPLAAVSGAALLTTGAGQELKLFRGGRVRMGSSRRDSARRANEVEREVELARPFYLGLREVTNAEFRRFLAHYATPPWQGTALDGDELPVAGVTWQLAAEYCNWLSRLDGLPPFYQIRYGEVLGINPAATGYRLPTEAEWEWAARVPPKGPQTVYPWGDSFPPRGRSGNYADTSAATLVRGALTSYTDGYAVAAPPGSFSANLHGLHDLGGNVSEWVHDVYDAAPPAAPARDPLGPPAGVEHVIKGASWLHGSATELRLAYRDFGAAGRPDLGFRLARYAQ